MFSFGVASGKLWSIKLIVPRLQNTETAAGDDSDDSDLWSRIIIMIAGAGSSVDLSPEPLSPDVGGNMCNDHLLA